MFDLIIGIFLGLVLIGSSTIWIFFQEKYWAYRKKEIKVSTVLQIAGVFQCLVGMGVFILVISNM